MSLNGDSTQTHQPATGHGRRGLGISLWSLRILIALVISFLVVLAFFVTGAISH